MTMAQGTYGAGPYGAGPYGSGQQGVPLPTQHAAGFILNEDQALKLKLENYGTRFYVTNYADLKQIPVAVYYRSPDPEQRQRTYPHITIDLIDIQPDNERMHRSAGFSPLLPCVAAKTPAPGGFAYWEDQFPMPWKLLYQLSCLSRDPTHDRQLGQLMYTMFPFAFGQLDMSAIDGTVRRADFVSMTRRDLPADANNKRIFRQIFTVAVSSEIFLSELETLTNVLSIHLDVEEWIPQHH